MGAYLQGQGGFTQLYDPTQWDLTPDASYTAGQATAIGISAKQLDTLKTRLENTKTQLQANNVQNLTGEQISGDLLTAVIWSWFAAAESHNRLSQNQAQMIENPGLSYGLFHAVADPIYSWGVVRKVTFPGVNMDIGHIRNLTWAKDNDAKKWIAYNRLRGQYMSALEHAVPERFFNDPAQCNLQGASNPTAGLPDCPQGISAVKALGIAATQGQKIYTITQQVYADNPNLVNTALQAHSYDTQSRIQQSLNAGLEVTVHERPITESGWTGAGFISIDPITGAGAYAIEGGANGGWYSLVANAAGALFVVISLASLLVKAGLIAAFFPLFVPYILLVIAVIIVMAVVLAGDNWDPKDCNGISYCDSLDAIQVLSALGAMAALFGTGSVLGIGLGLWVFYNFLKGKYFI